jgi:hypothetical protein
VRLEDLSGLGRQRRDEVLRGLGVVGRDLGGAEIHAGLDHDRHHALERCLQP